MKVKVLFILLVFSNIIMFSQTTYQGILEHTNSYFRVHPYNSSYDDGSHAKIFYDGNNRIINFWNSDTDNIYTNLRIGSLFSSQRIGVGTTNPNSKLDLGSNVSDPSVYPNKITLWSNGENNYFGFGISSKDLDYLSKGNHRFYTEYNGTPGSEKMVIQSNGNVGIGVSSPESKLHIYNGNSNGFRDLYASAIIEGEDSRLQLLSTNDGDNGSSVSLTNENSSWTFHHTTLNLNNRLDIGYRISNDIENITSLQDIFMSILPDGNIGIGTTNPDSWKLAVNGNIRAKEVKVETGWSDFVFYKDYNLPTLDDVENHIRKKGHLKDIPSAKEVEENGIFLGEMDSKLLQKIEELTLYTIQQEKKIKKLEALNAKIIQLQKRLDKLEKE